MLPLCRAEGIGVIPYSPLAGGRLTRDVGTAGSVRAATDQIARLKYDASAEQDSVVIGRVAQLAEKHSVSRARIALAWLLQKSPVTAPIVGATKTSHLDEATGALDVKLTPEEITFLEEPYVPHRVVGAQ